MEWLIRFGIGLLFAGLSLTVVIPLVWLLGKLPEAINSPSVAAGLVYGAGVLGILFPIGSLFFPWNYSATLGELWWILPIWAAIAALAWLLLSAKRGKRRKKLLSWVEDYPQEEMQKTLNRLWLDSHPGAVPTVKLCPVATRPEICSLDGELLMLMPCVYPSSEKKEFVLMQVLGRMKQKEGFWKAFAHTIASVYWWTPFGWLYISLAGAATACAAEYIAPMGLPENERVAYTVFAARGMTVQAPAKPVMYASYVRKRLRAMLTPAAGNPALHNTWLAFGILLTLGLFSLSSFGLLQAASGTGLISSDYAAAVQIPPVSAPVSLANEPAPSASEPLSSTPLPASSETASSAVEALSSEPVSSAAEVTSSAPASSAVETVSSTPASSSTPALTMPEYPPFPADLANALKEAVQGAADKAADVGNAAIAVQTIPPPPVYEKVRGQLAPKGVVTPMLEDTIQKYINGELGTTGLPPYERLPFPAEQLPQKVDEADYYLAIRGEKAYGLVLQLDNGWKWQMWIRDEGPDDTYELVPEAVMFTKDAG